MVNYGLIDNLTLSLYHSLNHSLYTHSLTQSLTIHALTLSLYTASLTHSLLDHALRPASPSSALHNDVPAAQTSCSHNKFMNFQEECKQDTKEISSSTVKNIPKIVRNVLVVDDSMACRAMNRKAVLVSVKEGEEIYCDMASDGKKGVDMVRMNMARFRSDTAATAAVIRDDKPENMTCSSKQVEQPLAPETNSNRLKSVCQGVYDIIFMDYQMPVMDGPTAIKAIRALGYTGRIVGLTGNALQSDQDYMRESGANDVLLKPVLQEALEAAIYYKKRKSFKKVDF